MTFAEFFQYSENLLMAQYEVSEIISHELMKGEVREDFLISTLKTCSDPEPILVKGTLSDGIVDAGQLDIILRRPFAQPFPLGTQAIVPKNDAICVIEVKGNCTGRDLKNAVKKAVIIRNMRGENQPLYGVFCYKVALTLRTIMRRFGFLYDRESETWFDNAIIPLEDEENWNSIDYLDLDFFICLEEGKQVFLIKYEFEPGKFRFTRNMQPPLIEDVFSFVRSLWMSANVGPAP